MGGVTDELRAWMRAHNVLVGGMSDLEAIVDRIDERHERSKEVWHIAGYKDGYDEGSASMRFDRDSTYDSGFDEGLATRYSDENIRSLGYVKLPVDRDGERWCFGDELLDDGIPCEVVGIGPNRLYYYVDATDTVEWTQADNRRHWHASTVEHVLDELEGMRGNGATYEDVVTRCADIARHLRRLLAKEGE